eukprot:2384844-Rhodomonas_salina.1
MEHISPVSFVNPDGAAPFNCFGSEGQKLAYKQLCLPTNQDKSFVVMLQATAAAMAKTNLDMSTDLVLGEQQKNVESMVANNISCKLVFGFKDWRFHVAKMELGL